MACLLDSFTGGWHDGLMAELTKMTVRVEPELLKRLKLLSVRDDKTVQEIVAGLVEAYVSRKEAEQHG